MSSMVFQGSLFFFLLILITIPLGWYIKEVMQGKIPKYIQWLQPLEAGIYKVIGKKSQQDMTAKSYIGNLLILSVGSFFLLFLMLRTQAWLPLNESGVENMSTALALNTAVSFVTNTNWQAYAGEVALSHFSQIFGLTVQNFISAAAGISVLCVFMRGFVQIRQKKIGNFWQDMTRSLVYILFPISFMIAILLISQGVIQTFQQGIQYTGLNGERLQLILGPVASQIAIKQLGTNGGGFFGANAAHPFENPTFLSNFIENMSILLIPMALIFAFGFWVKDWKQGRTILLVSLVFLSLAFIGVLLSEYYGPSFAHVLGQANMEGKEVRFGVGWSSLWAVSTTAASNGSVNAMLDSFTPIGGGIPMFLMQLGEIIFGGVGSGLYGMLVFMLLTVFIAGLLVGRSPEYLGKKLEPFDMKMASVVILTPLLVTLFGAIAMSLHPNMLSWLTNKGPHGFSELLYGATSLGNNNGSSFGGLYADSSFLNLLGGIMMAVTRFVPMIAIVYLAQNMSLKKKTAWTAGTLSTSNATFVVMLIIVILVIGSLSFLPAMALGPIAEFFVTR